MMRKAPILRRLGWRLRELRSALRHIWWRWSNERARTLEQLDQARAYGREQFERARASDHIAYQFTYPPIGEGGALLLAADEISREGPNQPCEHASQEYDTGAWNCDLERRDLLCWCFVADQLRDFNRAWADATKLNDRIASRQSA